MSERSVANGSIRAATIRDVADRAGVSKSLVSLVLRNEAGVSESRRRAVLEAVEALDYRPNTHARGLATTRSGTVGVLLNDLRNPWFVDLLAGLGSSLHAAGLAPVLADSHTDRLVGRRSVEAMLAQGVDGIVVVGTTTEAEAVEEAARSVPVVLAGTRDPALDSVDVVVGDDEAGSYEAGDHLVGLGHVRIAVLEGPGQIGRLRYGGFAAALRRAGLDPEEYRESGGMSEESGYAAARRLLARDVPPTAIFAFNDLAAIGALSAAADAGIDVPGQLSVVGYDNTYLAKIRHLSLTSVDNGNFAIGVQAGTYLAERIDEPVRLARVHLVPTSLQVRGSSARPA